MTEKVSAKPMNCSNTAEIFRTNEALNLMADNPQVEQWRQVPCATDYEVSNHGRIRRGERMLAGYRLHNGYIGCSVSQNGFRRSTTIHALVAEAFIPNPEGKPEVNHKNGVKDDNRAENLEWVTRGENILHSLDVLGNRPKPRPPKPVDTSPVFTMMLEAAGEADCFIEAFDGGRPGRLRTMVNGVHEPRLSTQTKLAAWLLAKFPRTSAKRVTSE